jgi:hypothetical protein
MTLEEAVHMLVRMHPLNEQKKFEDAIRTIVGQVVEHATQTGYKRGLADGKRVAIN